MSEENTQTQAVEEKAILTNDQVKEILNGPTKRGRGRPKGSKNKPKPEGYVAPEKTPRAKRAKAEPVTEATVTKTVKPSVVVVPVHDDVVEASVEDTE